MKTLLYNRIPKTASVSLLQWLSENEAFFLTHMPFSPMGFRREMSEDTRSYFFNNTVLSKEPLYALLEHDYTPFTIVRNPYDRLVSAWKFICQEEDGWWKQNNDKVGIGFKDFVSRFDEFSPIEKEIVRPQYELICDSEGNIDCYAHIGRFENLQGTIDFLKEHQSIEEVSPLKNLNSTEHDQYTEYYDADLLEFVEDMYSKDIEVFNYNYGE